jgi:PAS domain S-box-containing protein
MSGAAPLETPPAGPAAQDAQDPPGEHLHESRILLLAPTGNDARLTIGFVAQAGFAVEACAGMETVCQMMHEGCGAIVLAEESLGRQSLAFLIDALKGQPSWSDLPVIVITGGSEADQRRLRRLATSGAMSNIALLERPFHPETLLSAVEAALRARRRQYQVRDLLQTQRASELRLQNILDSISDAFASLDRNWRFTYVNRSYMKLVSSLYSSPEELLGQNVWEKFPDLVGTELARFYERAMEEQKPGVCEIFYSPINAWIEVHVHPSPEILSIYVQDVTNRRGADEMLRRRSQRTQLLSEALAQLLAAGDSDTVVRELFPKVAAHLGVDTYFNFMVTEEGDALALHSCQGIPEETARAIQRLEFGQAICGTVAQLRRPIVANDIQNSDYDKADLVRKFGIQAYACNLLMIGDRLLGTLSFASRTRRSFDEDELEFIRIISQYTAVALERLRNARALLKYAQRLSLAIAAADLGDWNWDAATDLMTLSERAAEIFGLSPGVKLTREAMREMLHENYRDRARAEAASAVATGSDYNIEYKINHPAGDQRWVSAKGRSIHAEDGTVTGMLGVVQDITERKRSVAVIEGQRRVLQLIAEDASLENVLDALMEAIEAGAATSVFCCILRADESGERLRHVSAPSLPPAYRVAIDGLVIRVGAGSCPTAAALKMPVYAADIAQDPHWVDLKDLALAHGLRACWSTPIFSKDGGLLGTFAMYYPQPREASDQDLPMVEMAVRTAAIAIERERGQKALRESEARYRTLMEQASDGIFVSDSGGCYVMANAAGCRMLGYTLDELRQIRIADIYVGGEFSGDEESSRELRAGKSLRIERKMRRKNGTMFDAEASVTMLPSGLVHRSVRDVTERKNAEIALLEAKNAAEAANRSKDRFLAVLSHELRTPLTPVLMTVAALEVDPDLDHALREDITMIRRNVELETKLIDDLLDLSRITSGKLRLRTESVKLNDAISQVCGICRPQMLEKGIRLHRDLGSEFDCVRADPARFQQILWNVLKNAAKFTPEGGEIFVTTTRATDGFLRVHVRDTGLGIAPDVLPRIFDAFEQGDPRVTRQFGGLGLGLAISKAIVELHGGSISVASDGIGEGSTFTIALPAIAASAGSGKTGQASEGAGPSKQMRLLVVEDHVDTARTLGRMLGRMGYLVRTTHDVASALELAAAEPFDLLISDLGLPDATGYELMKKVRRFSSLKGIAMSGFGMDEDIRKSREVGFSEHLVKPLDVSRLQQAIRRVAGSE